MRGKREGLRHKNENNFLTGSSNDDNRTGKPASCYTFLVRYKHTVDLTIMLGS